jgi:hypothetical protein
MKLIGISAFAVALLAAGSSWAGDGYCQGAATGPAGEKVTSTFSVDGGAIKSREAVWFPPRVHAHPLEDGPAIEVHYWPVAESGPAVPTAVGVSVTAFKGGAAKYGGAVAELTLGEGLAWRANLRMFLVIGQAQLAVKNPSFPAVNADLLDRVEGARQATVTIRAPDGAKVTDAVFDLSDHASRDALFHSAWAAAAQKASSPARCE